MQMNIKIQRSSLSTPLFHIILLDEKDSEKHIAILDSYKTFQGAMNQTMKRYSTKFIVDMEPLKDVD